MLQYPAYRTANVPYNARNLQKPTSLRLKPSTGLLELDIPIDTEFNYNPQRGSAHATSLKRSRLAQGGGTHGLSGGFNTFPAGRNIREDDDVDMKTIPAHPDVADEPNQGIQTLGGKIVKPCPGDPVYLIGSFQNNSLHLSHLDALVQVRPQLPHLDAADELERNRGLTAIARGKGKDEVAVNGEIPPPGAAPPAGHSARPESKAIDIKLKSSGPSSQDNDLSTNTNAKLLRAIQQEPWQTYEWVDEDEDESESRARAALHFSFTPPSHRPDNNAETPYLKSAISNSEWLDLMSAPRIDHGKKDNKGLMSKVKGRDRERRRRRRNEAARRERASATTARDEAPARADRSIGGPFEEEAVTRSGLGTAAVEAENTAPDDDDDDDDDNDNPPLGPSDEDSSEEDDDHGDMPDVEMVDLPSMPPDEGAIRG